MSDTALRGFPPVIGGPPPVLVLGSFPGVASLRQGEHDAHQRNQLWPIMASCTAPVLGSLTGRAVTPG